MLKQSHCFKKKTKHNKRFYWRVAVTRERLQMHCPEEIKQCYYMHINTPETKAKVLANSLVAKAHSIAYLFPFYPLHRVRL